MTPTSNNLKKQAEELAARRYSTFVFRDMTTEDEPIYVALNPELDGCFAQGETSKEARENLDLFRVDFIFHLLTHELPVPEPIWKIHETEKPTIVVKEKTDQPQQEANSAPCDQEQGLGISGRVVDLYAQIA